MLVVWKEDHSQCDSLRLDEYAEAMRWGNRLGPKASGYVADLFHVLPIIVSLDPVILLTPSRVLYQEKMPFESPVSLSVIGNLWSVENWIDHAYDQ